MPRKDIEPTLKLIKEYLGLNKNETFVIPAYQRAYSWGINQCDKLWQDIENYVDSGATDPYFFGTIIVDCSENNDLQLIDGQQRTTTFLLLLKALQLRLAQIEYERKTDETAALLKGLEKKYENTIQTLYKCNDEELYEILEDWQKAKNIIIIKNNSFHEQYKNELQKILESKTFEEAEKSVYKDLKRKKDNRYTNFFRNFKFFYERLEKYSETKLSAFTETFLSKCQIIEIRSWQIEQAIEMFNSLNSTGLPLSDADIISAQLYSNAKEDRDKIGIKWKGITDLADELEKLKIANIDSVLQQYMYILRAKNKEYSTDDIKKTADVTTPGVRKYYLEKDKFGKNILDKFGPLGLCKELYKILQIWDKIKEYPVVKLTFKFNENIKIYLMSYLYNFELDQISEKMVTSICESLMKLFTVLELVDLGYSSSKFKTFLFYENTKLTRVSTGEYDITELSKEISEHIIANWDKEDLAVRIREYTNNSLVYLNEYLYAKGQNLNFNFDDKVNIEHIMPASGHNITSIREDANIKTIEEFNELVNQIGNKILLEEDINKKLGRKWFKTKKQHSISEKSGYKNSKYNIAQKLADYPSDLWTRDDIEKATQKATNRILDFIFSI